MNVLGRSVLLPAFLTLPLIAEAVQMLVVVQQNRAFATKELTIARGDTIRFQNADEFLHDVYVDTTAMNVKSVEQEPGQSIDIRFPLAGVFTVRCGIHPKMRLNVTVTP